MEGSERENIFKDIQGKYNISNFDMQALFAVIVDSSAEFVQGCFNQLLENFIKKGSLKEVVDE